MQTCLRNLPTAFSKERIAISFRMRHLVSDRPLCRLMVIPYLHSSRVWDPRDDICVSSFSYLPASHVVVVKCYHLPQK